MSTAPYPRHHDVDAVIRDGSTIHIRPLVPSDEDALSAFLAGLSEHSRVLRFFHAVKDLGWAVKRFMDVDYQGRHGLLALRGDPERIVGHSFYAQVGPGRAEVALEVADSEQGRGVGTALLGQLTQAAVENDIAVLEADVLPENAAMLTVFRESGYPVRARAEYGVIRVEFETSTGPALGRFDEREHQSAVAAVSRFLRPRSIAVIGASRRRGTIGGEVFHNLLDSGFPGPVYPVSPHPYVQSVPAYQGLEDVPGEVDLAVIVVPAEGVVQAATAAAAKGVGALVVISSGFAEVGESGRARQAALLEVCRRSGMRLVGPNCMGLLTTEPASRFNATFAPAFPPAGRVAFMSQSGALGLAVIDRARSLGIGISSFVSVGNKADISGNDLLEYWEDDPATDLVLLYLESFGNPRRFSRIARRMSRRKPILAVKSGSSAAGARATASHTGALLAATDATVDALFEQAGVLRCQTLGEMFDVATLLAAQAPPEGPRVGIITNAGGLGILCADACAGLGLEVPELTEDTRRALRAFLPAEASVGNPVDMIASATAEHYEAATRVLADSGDVDAVIVIFIPPLVTRAEDVADAIRRAAPALAGRKPLLCVFTSSTGLPTSLSTPEVAIPTYTFPEEAARALGRAWQWGARRQRPGEEPVQAVGRHDEAHAIVATALGSRPEGGWLTAGEVSSLLNCYDIESVAAEVAGTPRQAAAAARRLGGPVAIKAVASGLVHKSDVGGVLLNIEPRHVARASREMASRIEERGLGPVTFLVQRMAPAGTEMIAGVVQDPVFGPVVACGAGGTAVELVRDIGFRIAPLTADDVDSMLVSLRTYPLLTGYRGAPPADVTGLKRLLLNLGSMAAELQSVVEVDLNPVIVTSEAVTVVDARVKVASVAPRPPEGSRPRPRP